MIRSIARVFTAVLPRAFGAGGAARAQAHLSARALRETLEAGDSAPITWGGMVVRTAAHVCFVGMLVLLVFLAAGCGGASKGPAVASLGPTTTTTPSSAGPAGAASGNALRSSSLLACARRGWRASRPRRVDRSRAQTVAGIPVRDGEMQQAVPEQRIRWGTAHGGATHVCSLRRGAFETTACRTSPTRRFPAPAGRSFRPYPGSTPARQRSSEPPRRAGVGGSPAGAEDVLFRESPSLAALEPSGGMGHRPRTRIFDARARESA